MKWWEVKEKDASEVVKKNRDAYGLPAFGQLMDGAALPVETIESQQVYTDGKDFCFLVEEDILTPDEKAKCEDVKPEKFDKIKEPKK